MPADLGSIDPVELNKVSNVREVTKNRTWNVEVDGLTLLKLKSDDERRRFYAGFADSYDQVTGAHGYRAPNRLCELACQYCASDDLILIIGCGTGQEGELLHKNGYKNLYGLDGCEKMLEKAREKGIFVKLFHEMLQPNAKSSIPTNCYDALLCVGCFAPGHLDERHVDDLIRLLKPGGVSIIGTREIFINDPGPQYDYHFSLEKKLKSLEAMGKLTILGRHRQEDYSESSIGVFFVHRVN